MSRASLDPREWLAWTGPSPSIAAAVTSAAERTAATLDAVDHAVGSVPEAWGDGGADGWRRAFASWRALPDEVRRRAARTPSMAALAALLRRRLPTVVAGRAILDPDHAAQLARLVLGTLVVHRSAARITLDWPASRPLWWPGAPCAFVLGDSDATQRWVADVGADGGLVVHDERGGLALCEPPGVEPPGARRLSVGAAPIAGGALQAAWCEPLFALDFDDRFPHDQRARASGPDEAERWQATLAAAATLIGAADPQLAQELGNVIRVLVPLRELERFHVSRVEADSPGAVFCSLADADRIAEALVHEYGHTKLHLLQRLVDLLTDEGRARAGCFSPWRPDPRPLDGVLHGAFVAVWVARLWDRLWREAGLERARGCWYRAAAFAVAASRELSGRELFTAAGWELVQALQREALWYARRAADAPAFQREAAAIADRRRQWAAQVMQPAEPPPMHPLSIPTYVVKVATRCNLDCSYCYEYKFADQSWRAEPHFMTVSVARTLGERMADHARVHDLDRVEVCLHGGEPLLIGKRGMVELVEAMRAGVGDAATLKIGLQTNGVLLDEEWVDLLVDQRILVGVSLDGTEAVHDRARVDHAGRGSHARAVRGIRLLAERGRSVYAGLLCVIDPDASPEVTFDHLAGLGAPNIDFLLPHDNWPIRIARRPGDEVVRRLGHRADGEARFGRWLAAAFDRYLAGPPTRARVRFFDETIRVLLGGQATLESVGLSDARLLVIAASGGFENVDTLKVTRPGATALRASALHHAIDEAAAHPAVLARNIRREGLCRTCRGCPFVTTCGGGYLPHRWHPDNELDNPSVFCADLRFVIGHIARRLEEASERLT